MSTSDQPTAEDLQRLRRRIIARLFSVPEPSSDTAAEQFLRTQFHPKVLQTVEHLYEILRSGGAPMARSLASQLGYSSVQEMFPQASKYLDLYREGKHSAQLSELYRELVRYAALTNPEFREKLFAHLYAQKAFQTLQDRFRQLAQSSSSIPEELFWEEFKQIQRESEHQKYTEHTPKREQSIQQVVVPVHQAQQQKVIGVPGQIRLFDAVHRQHDVVMHAPVELEQYIVDRQVSIPWERVRESLTIECALPDQYGSYHLLQHIELSAAQLQQLRDRGSAVPTTFGNSSDIRVYDEHLSIPMHQVLPDAHIASLRATPTSMEIKKLYSPARLTVFV